jgi:hypothetical protein
MSMMEYRRRIYEKYASEFQGKNQIFNTEEALRWSRAYDY